MAEARSLSDPEIRAGSHRAAVIPVGATEQHGPHLPVSTDADIVGRVCAGVAEEGGFLLLPPLEYGVSFEHRPLFNLSIRGATLRAVLSDLSMSLLDAGIRTVFVINGHHGNLRALEGLGQKVAKASGRRLDLHVLSYWHFMGREFDHAGFVETSLMLAVSDGVRMDLAERGLVTDGMTGREVRRLGRMASKSFLSAAPSGVWGDPTGATEAEGRRILAEVVSNLLGECRLRLKRGPGQR